MSVSLKPMTMSELAERVTKLSGELETALEQLIESEAEASAARSTRDIIAKHLHEAIEALTAQAAGLKQRT